MRVLLFALCVILMLAIATAAYAWNLRSVAVSERENAFRSAALAEEANKRAQNEADIAHKSEQNAVTAREDAKREEQRAEEAAKAANDQKAIAIENLRVAQTATQRAREATAEAEENAKQVAGALERGELIRVGLESMRREDFNQALDAFEQLEAKLKTLQPGGSTAQKFTSEQLKQLENDYGWTLSHLGDTYHKLREFEKAIEHYEKGRVILERVTKDEPRAILLETYHGLAHAYHDNGMFRASAVHPDSTTISLTPEQQLLKAEEFYKRAASYQEELKPDNPLVLVSSLKNLAQLYIDIGRFDDAEKSLKTVVDTYKTIEEHGGDRTVSALKELAEFYRSRTRYEDAARAYNELIDVQEGLTDTQSDPEMIRALSDNYSELSQIYNALKDEKRSDAAFRLAEKIQQIALKLRNERELIANLKKLSTVTLDEDLDLMGDSYITLERFKEAAHAYDAALGIREQIRSEQNAIAISYLKLGNLYREQFKDYAKAEDYYKRLIQNRKNLKGGLMGPGDPLTQYIGGLRKLAALYIEDMNKPAEAESLLNEALSALGPKINGRLAWDDEVNIYGDLITLYQRQQKDLQPIQVRKLEAMTRRRNDFTNAYRSPDHQQFMYAYVTAAGDVADVYVKQQNKPAAEAAYAQVFNFMKLQTHFLNAKQLETYLNNLEKYQALLRESNKAVKAAEFDAFVKEGRARQKDLESIQTEAAQEKAEPKP
jgi:tetratricopeptide (TPR) repeat protein